MTKYYISKDNRIVLFDEDLQRLVTTLRFMPQYAGLEILETGKEIIQWNGEFVFKEDIQSELFAEAKAKRLEENKEAYNAALKAGVTYKNALFDCDTLAAVRVMGQMAAMQAMAISEEPTIDWFDYDYQPVTLTTEEFLELAGLITLNTRRIETLNCGFNTAISGAESLAELEAINISYSAEQESAEGSSSGENLATEDEIQD
ncbi:TPA: DUF4376 domain-containing protein [Candidatus Spyradomonas excrementavium]|nr:DUF4376 domain-containing protein [Candidatus Spyradomonas excrementavium]